ncbi:hypothetical protein HPULCUR_011014 [Helicostylum pulchrum]|uniref:E2F/DP family winged-helix DNA-binding domain-containing protein n=1 Tax=Helicostylum pulchrum TaxID=562976 RepID=A0ABP9YEW3_9FUNG
MTFTVDRAPPSPYITCIGGDRSGLLSDVRYTSNQRRDVVELRPFLFNHVSDNNNNSKYHLPPIQNVIMTTPTASPSPPFDSYYCLSSASPISSIASSPTPVDEEDDDVEDELVDQQKMILNNNRRKGSIASLLNSDPELKQLDEEESKCNYQSHFIDNYHPTTTTTTTIHHSLKRGRPRQDQIEISYPPVIKKQRKSLDLSNNNTLDCVQACQSRLIASVITIDSPRATKGLRHFSKQVCEKVAEKGVTSYNEVADELSLDIQNTVGNEKHTYDQKNIRRRVYDALNVLMAMNIIAKDKKVITWLGIPECYKQQTNNNNNNNSTLDQDVIATKNDTSREFLLEQIEQEELRQKELICSLTTLREGVNNKLSKRSQIHNLVWRNQRKQSKDNNSNSRISFPFFIVVCPTKDKHIDIVNNSRSAFISFCHENQLDSSRKIVYEDSEVLRHLQLDNGDPSATRS